MDNVGIVVHKRDVTGTRSAKRMRSAGLIPGVMYGHGKAAVQIAVEPHVLRDALSTEAGMHAVLAVTFEGQKRTHRAIVKDLQLDKVKQTVTHVDLQEIRLDETIETTVTVTFEGEAKGVKTGGLLDEVTREVTVKGLVTAIPEHLVLDISGLDVNDTARVADLPVPDGIEVLDDPEEVLCSVLAPRKAEAVAGAEVGEWVEGAPVEPELVRKPGEYEGAET